MTGGEVRDGVQCWPGGTRGRLGKHHHVLDGCAGTADARAYFASKRIGYREVGRGEVEVRAREFKERGEAGALISWATSQRGFSAQPRALARKPYRHPRHTPRRR